MEFKSEFFLAIQILRVIQDKSNLKSKEKKNISFEYFKIFHMSKSKYTCEDRVIIILPGN